MSVTTAIPLPRPADRPDTDVVIYDGDCGICTAQVSKLPWWDCQGKLAYLSLHDPEVQARFPDLPHDRMMQEMVIVDRHGNRHWGPAAIRYLTSRLRRLRWAAPVLYFPGSMLVWRPLYRWIARNRYRLSGNDCSTGGVPIAREVGAREVSECGSHDQLTQTYALQRETPRRGPRRGSRVLHRPPSI